MEKEPKPHFELIAEAPSWFNLEKRRLRKVAIFSEFVRIEFGKAPSLDLHLSDLYEANYLDLDGQAVSPEETDRIREVRLIARNEELAIKREWFASGDDFWRLLGELNRFFAQDLTLLRIDNQLKKCSEQIAHENLLIEKTEKVLQKTYHTIYQPFTFPGSDRKRRNELLDNPFKVYYYQDQAGLNYFFMRNQYHPEVTREEMAIGEKLIETTQTNLRGIELRKASLLKLRNTLLTLKKRHKLRMQLNEALGEAEHLQDLGAQSMSSYGTIKIEQGLLIELEEMQNAIAEVENSGRVEVLKNYHQTLDSIMDDNQSLLNEINRKLGV